MGYLARRLVISLLLLRGAGGERSCNKDSPSVTQARPQRPFRAFGDASTSLQRLPSSWLTRSSRPSALAGQKMKARIKLDVVWIDLSERAAHHHDVPRFPTVLLVGDA